VITRAHRGAPDDPLTGLTNIDYVRIYAHGGARYVDSSGFGELPGELYKEVEWQSGGNAGPETIERDAVVIERDHTRVVTEEYSALGGVPARTYTSFGNWMVVKPGETVAATLTFDVPGMFPPDIVSKSASREIIDTLLFRRRQTVYYLIWQKQPGMDTVRQRFTFMAPDGVEPYVVGERSTTVRHRELVWNDVSDQDHWFVVGMK